MKHVHFFEYNVPKDNHITGRTNGYVNIIAEWDSNDVLSDGRPMVFCAVVNVRFHDLVQVKDWLKVYTDVNDISQQHFSNLAKRERINHARATLMSEGELTGIPTLDLYTQS